VSSPSGAVEEAVSLYRQVLTLSPSNPGANLNLGLLLLQTGQTAEGNQLVATAVQLDPTLASRISAIPQPVPSTTPATAPPVTGAPSTTG